MEMREWPCLLSKFDGDDSSSLVFLLIYYSSTVLVVGGVGERIEGWPGQMRRRQYARCSNRLHPELWERLDSRL